jgi:hypothetical protein
MSFSMQGNSMHCGLIIGCLLPPSEQQDCVETLLRHSGQQLNGPELTDPTNSVLFVDFHNSATVVEVNSKLAWT